MTTTTASKSEVAYEWLRSRITGHMFSPATGWCWVPSPRI